MADVIVEELAEALADKEWTPNTAPYWRHKARIAYQAVMRSGRPRYRQLLWQTEIDGMPLQITYPDPLSLTDLEAVEQVVGLWLRGLRRRCEEASAPPMLAGGEE